MKIDTSYDFTTGMNGKDPDSHCRLLREHHRLLWSKALPSGEMLVLKETTHNRLSANTSHGEFILSSDRAINSFSLWQRMKGLIATIPPQTIQEFDRLTETIGAIMIWPANKVDNKPTINGERGFNQKICDRLDLTIECIRRFYANEPSPMSTTLERYRNFFELFGNFEGYIDFFLLQDAVSYDYQNVIIAEPFDNFESKPLPKNTTEYYKYMGTTVQFIQARNQRIDNYALENIL